MPRGTPENDAPESYRKSILRNHGTVPGQKRPLWRVCLAENCIRKSSGILHHMPTGEVSVFEVDGKGKVHGRTNLVSKVESGTFELQRYPVEGWIVERWFPPATWGTPEEWASHRAKDGGRILSGDFPREGDYFLVNGPFDEIPDLGDLENAIRMWEHGHDNRPTDILKHYKALLDAEEALYEKRMEKLVQDLEYMRQNELVPVLKSGSLEAQRVRDQLSNMVGDRSHLGAVLNP